MTDWKQIKAWLAAGCKVLLDRGDAVAVTLPGAAVRIAIARGAEALMLAAQVCSEGRLDPRSALRCSAMHAAALSLHKGRYLLRDSVPTEGLAWPTLSARLLRLTRETQRLQRALRRDSDPSLFVHYS